MRAGCDYYCRFDAAARLMRAGARRAYARYARLRHVRDAARLDADAAAERTLSAHACADAAMMRRAFTICSHTAPMHVCFAMF